MRSSRRRVMGRGPRRSESKERFWRNHTARHAAGGLSVRAYCERHGLAEPSFYAWRRELARRNQAARRLGGIGPRRRPQTVGRFVRLDPVALAEPTSRPAAIEIVLADGVRIVAPAGITAEHLRCVLAALGATRHAGMHDDRAGRETRPC